MTIISRCGALCFVPTALSKIDIFLPFLCVEVNEFNASFTQITKSMFDWMYLICGSHFHQSSSMVRGTWRKKLGFCHYSSAWA